jgi:hypothetical protein
MTAWGRGIREARRRRGRASILALLIAICTGLVAALAIADTPESYVGVARGKVAGEQWTLGLASHRGRRCFALGLLGQFYGETSYCEAAGEPPELWQRRTGNADERAAVEIDVTTPRVRKLKLLLGHPGGHPVRPTWETMPTRLITAAQAAEAHLKRNFRFAVPSGRGPNLCVEKVRAFDRNGVLLESISVPCEF